jgi:hypothetical protein
MPRDHCIKQHWKTQSNHCLSKMLCVMIFNFYIKVSQFMMTNWSICCWFLFDLRTLHETLPQWHEFCTQHYASKCWTFVLINITILSTRVKMGFFPVNLTFNQGILFIGVDGEDIFQIFFTWRPGLCSN